jgi:hypothetical protein
VIEGRESATRASIGLGDCHKFDPFASSRDNGKCPRQLGMKFETYQAAAHLIDP